MVTSSKQQTHAVSRVRCADGSLYTSYSTNVDKRVVLHNTGKGARSTRSRRPVTLLVSWSFLTKGEALHAECMIKQLSRAQKLRLIDPTQASNSEMPMLLQCTQAIFHQAQDSTQPPVP